MSLLEPERILPSEKSSLILGPYKTPLSKVKNGYGYYGALSFDVHSRLQCHICGFLFDNLARHVLNHHKMKAGEYREKYKLSPVTALVSERFREELKARMMRVYARKTEEEKREWREKKKEGWLRSQEGRKKAGSMSLEVLNKRGTCPDQLISLIQKAAEKYGGKLTYRQFQDYYQTQRYFKPINKTFGSWKKALAMAKVQPGLNGEKSRGAVRYTDQQLLDMLLSFYEANNRIPTYSDCKRGLLPTGKTYKKRFGSMHEARTQAGIPEYGDQEESIKRLVAARYRVTAETIKNRR